MLPANVLRFPWPSIAEDSKILAARVASELAAREMQAALEATVFEMPRAA